MVGSGEEFVILGDWNCQPDEEHIGELIASGAIRECDDANRATIRPTSLAKKAERVIDYGLYRGNIEVRDRSQGLGPSATHEWVGYEVSLDSRADGKRWPKRQITARRGLFSWPSPPATSS